MGLLDTGADAGLAAYRAALGGLGLSEIEADVDLNAYSS
jgi:hypothetical protein